MQAALANLGKDLSSYDLIFEKPIPLTGYAGSWKVNASAEVAEEWDALWRAFPLQDEATYIALQPQTETGSNYGYEKNWPFSSWKEFIERLSLKKA